MDNSYTIHIMYLFAKIWKVNYYFSLKSRNSLLKISLYMYLSTFLTVFCSENASFLCSFFKIYYVQVRTAPAYQTKPVNLVPIFPPLKSAGVFVFVSVICIYSIYFFKGRFFDLPKKFFFLRLKITTVLIGLTN